MIKAATPLARWGRCAAAGWPPAAAVLRRRRCHPLLHVHASAGSSRSSSSNGSSGNGSGRKQLTILHFNDVYNIEQRAIEPVGGAARFATAAARYAGESPLVLFSGDCLNPSLMSAFTRGEQMVHVLNGLGVHAAAVGNHDFDFGVPTLQQHMKSFAFPWLLSNVLDSRTGQPLGGAKRSLILEWGGVRVGLMGLVEREWLLTIPSVEESDITFVDYVEEGRRLAAELAAQGAELIVALTHMRTPNDLVLAANVPEIQLILGGHDHHWEVTASQPHGTLVFKSGTDFREFSILRLGVPASLSERPSVEYHRVEVDGSVPEEPRMQAVVQRYLDVIGTKLDDPLGWTHVDLDARFDVVRRRESNLGDMFADIIRISLGADVAFFNGGTMRSDAVHAAGQLRTRDFVSILPFTDELVLLELQGAELLECLEVGVSSYPSLEGRFLQVSGVHFAFDPEQPPGSRVVPGSVEVAGAPLELGRQYKVATKAYLRSGKDGFASLKSARVCVDGETNPRLATLVMYLWMRVEQLNESLADEWQRMLSAEAAARGHPTVDEESLHSSIDSWEHHPHAAEQQRRPQHVGAAAAGGSNGAAGSSSSNGSGPAVYSPGAAEYGSFSGGPGAIPQEVEERVQEVSSTGAAISLALLLQARSEHASGSDSESEGGVWAALAAADEQQRTNSSAALGALSFLQPCAHGLDELIIFDASKRKFGIAPSVEGRIRMSPAAGGL